MKRESTVHLELANQKETSQKVFVEPWGDELSMPSGAVWRFESDGTGSGVVAVEVHPQGLAIVGLCRTNMKITSAGTTIWESFQPIDPPD